MAPIEEIVEGYNEDHTSRLNRAFHILGILIATIGLLSFLWYLPAGLIKSWLGDHPFANWATVYAVIMIIYYGSESFSLTFAGGVFFQGLLFLIDFLEGQSFLSFEQLITIELTSGFALMFLGHAIQGNIRAFRKDLVNFLVAPVWLFRFVYRWLGVPF